MNKAEKIKISVIIPIYNTQKYLKECLDSIVNQTYTNLDIILVDDGSTDNSGDICDKYAQIDSRINVVHKKNQGLVAARKTGIENAMGEYITFVDSDDYVDLDTYEKIVSELVQGKIDMIVYGMIEEYPDHKILKRNKFLSGLYNKLEIEHTIIPQMLSYNNFYDFGILPNLCCKFISREYLLGNMYDVNDEVIIGEDVDATYQMLINIDSLLILDYAPYHYCKHYDSMMWKKLDYKAILVLENDLRKSFSKSKYKNVLEAQLDEYITFVTLLKCPHYILKDKLKGINFALYGAGGFGQAIYGEYKNSVSLWVDKAYEKYQDISLPVESVDSLLSKNDQYDVIFIAILNVELCERIKEELIQKGIKKHILYYDNRREW